MGFVSRLRNLLKEWNQWSDEYSDIMIQKEYRGFMHIIGLYPNVNKAGLFWAVFRAILVVVLLFSHTIGLTVSAVLLYDINFIFFSTALHYVLVVGLAFLHVLHFNTNRHYFARFHTKMYFNFYNYHEEITDEIRELIKNTKKQKIRYSILPMFTALIAACILLLAPVLDKYGTFDFDIETSINFNLPLPMVYIFDSKTGAGYLLALTHQLSSAMLCGLVLGGTGYVFIVLASTITLQMRILIHRLDTIESRASSLYEAKYGSKPSLDNYDSYKDEKFSNCLDICLRKCVEHHKVILSELTSKLSENSLNRENLFIRSGDIREKDYKNWEIEMIQLEMEKFEFHLGKIKFDLENNISEVKDFYSIPLFSFFLVAALIIALAMLGSSNWKVLPGNTLVSLMLCLIEIAFLGILSSLGQSITDLNEDIRNSIYGIKWYLCKKSFCLKIRILLSKTLLPLNFTALGLIKICHATHANIINSAYSYYNLASATRS